MPLSVRLSLSRFLDPALLLVVVLGVGLYLLLRRPAAEAAIRRARWGRWLACAAWAGLWALSTPLVASGLTRLVEMRGPDLATALVGKDRDRAAMVVLAGALRDTDGDLPPRETLDAASTQRVLTASRLWHEQGFGLVVLSGAPDAQGEAMLDLMTTLGVPPDRVVLESRSWSTRQNAANTAAILKGRNIESVVLVTSATHLRRAVKDFAAAGVVVIPAAAEVFGKGTTGVDGLLPAAAALARTHACLHEILGYVRG